MSDYFYRRVRIGSEEHARLEEAWFSYEGDWEGVRILVRSRAPGRWAVYGFSDELPADEVVDLLPGEPCDERGRHF